MNEHDDTGERWTFGDPETVYARRQAKNAKLAARTCAGCRRLMHSPRGGPEVACEKRMRPPAKDIDSTRRCDYYFAWPDTRRPPT